MADGIVIARGYLGISLINSIDVVFVQKYIISKCNVVGKPVILQTQILESMINRTTPTRSEVCDISTAIQLGLDALILSAETACGKYPREATRMCGRICLETE